MNEEVCEGFKSARGHCTSIGKDIFFYFYLLLLSFCIFNFYFIIGTKKSLFSLYILIPVLTDSPLPIPPTSPHPFPFNSPERARQIAPRKAQGPPHYIHTEQGIHPERIDSKKVSTNSRNESWYYCQWPHNLPQAYSYYPH